MAIVRGDGISNGKPTEYQGIVTTLAATYIHHQSYPRIGILQLGHKFGIGAGIRPISLLHFPSS